MYVIIACYRCGLLLLAKKAQKTRQCSNCQARLVIGKTKKIAHAKSAQEASSLIRTIKARKP